MKLALLVAAFAQASALSQVYTFTCTGVAGTCTDHTSMIIVGETPSAKRYIMGCDGTAVGTDPCDYDAITTSPDGNATDEAAFSFTGNTFTLVTNEQVHFVTFGQIVPLTGAQTANTEYGQASATNLPATYNDEIPMGDPGSVTAVTLASPSTTQAGGAVSVNCKTHTGTGMGTVSVTLPGQAAVTAMCFATSDTPPMVDGVLLVTQTTAMAGMVTVTVTDPLFILSGGPTPRERTEFVAIYADGAGPSTPTTGSCNNGSTMCTFPIGTLNHILIGGPQAVVVAPPPATCAVSCTSFLVSNGCTAATQNVANVAAATCANGATPLVVRDNCGTTGNNTAVIQCIGIVTATDLLAGAAFGDSLVTLFALAAANGQLQQVYVALQTGRIGYAISSVCLATCITGRVDEETDYFVAFCITPCTINTRRQVAVRGATPVIVCPYPTAAQQRACFQESVCNGGLLTTDTCFVLGVAESCPICPVARVSSESKKGLYGLLGLLALIPLLLCCCCLLLALLLCLRRRKPAEPIMMPMTAAYPCMPEPCAVVPSCTPDVHCTTNAFACY